MNQLPFGPLSAVGGLLCPLIMLAFIGFIIFSIVKAIGRGGSGTAGGARGSALNVTTQLGEDGFWIGPCPCGLSALIYYEYWSNGVRYSGQIPYQPGSDGRQFAYTGRKPDQVSIVRMVEQTDDASPDIVPPIVAGATGIWASSPSEAPDTSNSQPPASQFPSAY